MKTKLFTLLLALILIGCTTSSPISGFDTSPEQAVESLPLGSTIKYKEFGSDKFQRMTITDISDGVITGDFNMESKSVAISDIEEVERVKSNGFGNALLGLGFYIVLMLGPAGG